MTAGTRHFEHLRPWVRLDLPTQRLLASAYAHFLASPQEGLDAESLAFRAGVPLQAIHEARDRGFLQRSDTAGRLQPTVLAALYVDEAADDLAALEGVLGFLAGRYTPHAEPLRPTELEALGFPSPRFDRAVTLAESLGVQRVRTDALTSLRPSLRDHELPSLEARLLEEYRGKFVRQAPPSAFDAPRTLPVRLTALELSNFRALRSIRLELGALNVLVGPNASGKSTALDAIGFVATCFRHGLDQALADAGGLGRVRTLGTRDPLRIGLAFSVTREAGKSVEGRYALGVAELGRHAVVDEERLELGPGTPYVDGKRGFATLRLSDGATEDRIHAAGTLALEELVDGRKFPVQTQIRAAFADIALVDRDPFLAGDDTTGWPGSKVRRRGAMIEVAPLLEFIADDPSRTARLGAFLAALLPRVCGVESRVVNRPGGDFRSELLVREEGLPEPLRLDELSAGTRQLLLLSAIQLQEHVPTVLLIEEPDAGVHPGALPALRDLLRSLAARCTIIATTHSPQLVALLDPEKEIIALERTDDGVRARSLADATRSQKWLEAFGAHGEAFFHRAVVGPR